MYRAIEGAYYDEFEFRPPAMDGTAPRNSRSGTGPSSAKTPSPASSPMPILLGGTTSDNLKENQRWCSGLAFQTAYEDLGENALGPDVDAWRYDRLHVTTHKHAMTDVPVLGDWLNVGPYGLPAAKDALCKYEFKLKRDVDYSIFSGPSKRIGIDFADVDGAESILPTGQSGNVFSPFYDNQAPLYHAGQFRKMRLDRADIEAHTTAVASLRPQTDR